MQGKDPCKGDDLSQAGSQPSTVTPVTRPPILTEEDIKAISKLPISKKRALQKMFANLTTEVLAKWGQDGYAESSKHRYVKYLDNYLTRADIHFDAGKVYVSTISQDDPKGKLREAITQILLMPPDPKSVDAFGDKAIGASDKPFFLGMILDEQGKDIKTKREARNFANYLLKNQLQAQSFAKGRAYFVEISMAPDHMDKREYQYVELVKVAAQKYKVPEGLVYAVMRTESSFNPYAISSAGAYGLMQVMQKTAVADVYKLMKNDARPPSKQQLFDPETNIDIGTAYLSLVRDRYLRDITEPTNRHFSMISAYNAGAGSVLEVFDKDRLKAAQIISKKSHRQVYQILVTDHPKEEARRYLQKVLSYQRDFDQNLLND
ncbi:MAG: murein transglycosylase domain-containing protein [Enterovibrio sp.]